MKKLTISESFAITGNQRLEGLTIAYHTLGELNHDKSNVVWVFHALTGNSNPSEWWPGIVGAGCVFDPKDYFIICANMLGSCYGSTGPKSFDFPLITIRDQVNAFQILSYHLEIDRIKIGIGGSMGGQHLLEWAVAEPDTFETIIPIATNVKHSPWGIAFNETQRMAIKNNPKEGIQTARAIAMLSYRHYHTYQNTQLDSDHRRDEFSAASYQRYQGKKLAKRFSPYSYYTLSKAMDSHDIGRDHANLQEALKRINSKCIMIGVDSDILFPIGEQQLIANHIAGATLCELISDYGHDAFLIEVEQLNSILRNYI